MNQSEQKVKNTCHKRSARKLSTAAKTVHLVQSAGNALANQTVSSIETAACLL